MRWKLFVASVLFSVGLAASGQVAPAAKGGSESRLGVGGGLSDFRLDWGNPRMLGISAWADYDLFHGLGVEAEYTGLRFDRPSYVPHMSQDTYRLNLTYKYRYLFHRVRPYAKSGGGIASTNFPYTNPNTTYKHDNFTMFDDAIGAEYKVSSAVVLRGDYEYQFWRHYRAGPHDLNPSGFTVGATYYFHRFGRRS